MVCWTFKVQLQRRTMRNVDKSKQWEMHTCKQSNGWELRAFFSLLAWISLRVVYDFASCPKNSRSWQLPIEERNYPDWVYHMPDWQSLEKHVGEKLHLRQVMYSVILRYFCSIILFYFIYLYLVLRIFLMKAEQTCGTTSASAHETDVNCVRILFSFHYILFTTSFYFFLTVSVVAVVIVVTTQTNNNDNEEKTLQYIFSGSLFLKLIFGLV